MDEYIQCYLTDVSKVKKVFGCKNKLFLETISKKLQMDIEDMDDDYDEQIDEKNNATLVLKDIINGEINCTNIPFMYGLLYEKIVGIFGEQIYSPNDEFHIPFLEKIYVANTAFIGIPTQYTLPKIVSILHENLEEEKQKFASVSKLENIDEKEFVVFQKDYLFAFDKAIQAKKDLVFVVS